LIRAFHKPSRLDNHWIHPHYCYSCDTISIETSYLTKATSESLSKSSE
jgi:hypothetical protein